MVVCYLLDGYPSTEGWSILGRTFLLPIESLIRDLWQVTFSSCHRKFVWSGVQLPMTFNRRLKKKKGYPQQRSRNQWLIIDWKLLLWEIGFVNMIDWNPISSSSINRRIKEATSGNQWSMIDHWRPSHLPTISFFRRIILFFSWSTEGWKKRIMVGLVAES